MTILYAQLFKECFEKNPYYVDELAYLEGVHAASDDHWNKDTHPQKLANPYLEGSMNYKLFQLGIIRTVLVYASRIIVANLGGVDVVLPLYGVFE